MANIVPILNYAANTFGDWVIATNALSTENNTLAKANYTKDSGTLYLNDSTLGLQVANGAIIQGQLRVQGIGSSALVEKNLVVEGQSYFQNTLSSFVASGPAEVQGRLTLNAQNTGLYVANNVSIDGNILIDGNNTTNGSTTIVGTLLVSDAANVDNDLTVTNNVNINDSLTVTNSIDSDTLNVQGLSTTGALSVDQNIEGGGNATVRYSIITDKLQANTHTNTATAFVSGNTYTRNLQANTSVVTPNITSTLLATTNVLDSGLITSVTIRNTNQDVYEQANINHIIANTATINVLDGDETTYNVVTANVYVTTDTVYTRNLTANAINASSNLVTPSLTVTRKIDANSGNVFVGSLQALGQLTVGGNFVINGTTVYNTNTFTINAGSNEGSVSKFGVNRGLSGANAEIKWNEPSKQFELNDVDNGQYYRILTDEFLTSSTSVVSTTNVATAAAANTLNNYINRANTFLTSSISSANTWSQANVGSALAAAKAYTNTANNGLRLYTDVVVLTTAETALYRANTMSNTFVGTSGSANPLNGSLTFAGANGVTISGVSSTLTVSTPQDLRRTAAPKFTGLELTSTALEVASGGTGAKTPSDALRNLLPDATSVTPGWVLSTQGPGNYSWVAGGTGGGGGTQPGTRISSTKTTGTGDGTTRKFATGTYTVGSGQLRVYQDGVRQFDGFSEFSNSVVIFSTPPASGSSLLLEVDGYMNYEYYANNITATKISGLTSVDSTIQTTLETLNSSKATKESPQFTGVPLGVTPSTATSNTMLATTAYVKNQDYITSTTASSTYATKTGSGASGTWTINASGWSSAVGNTTESIGITSGGVAPGANKIVRTQGNGYTFVNYINSDTVRNENETPNQFIITNDSDNYYRKANVATVRNVIQSAGITATGVPASGITGQTGMYTDANRPGPYRLYRRDDSSNYSVQTYWTGSYWRLYGYNHDTAHADTHVGHADTADRLNNSHAFTNGTDGWFRSKGSTGWYNEDYTGGIYMVDSTFVRTYNSKHFFADGANLYASGSVTSYYSDERLKNRRGNITGALDAVTKLNGFRYTNNELAKQNGYTDDEVQLGLSAQEVEALFPEVIKLAPFDMKSLDDGTIVSKSGENYKTLDYSKLVPVLVEAIKELKAEIDVLKGQTK